MNPRRQSVTSRSTQEGDASTLGDHGTYVTNPFVQKPLEFLSCALLSCGGGDPVDETRSPTSSSTSVALEQSKAEERDGAETGGEGDDDKHDNHSNNAHDEISVGGNDVDDDYDDDFSVGDESSVVYVSPKKLIDEDLEGKYVITKSFLVLTRYNAFLNELRNHPELVGYKSPNHDGETLLHVLASRANAPPENVILRAISQNPSAVSILDNHGNSLLHCAAKTLHMPNAKQSSSLSAFILFLKFCRNEASRRNNDGDLPLHLVAGMGSKGAEQAAAALIEVNPSALTTKNASGLVPLHMACAEGSNNIKCLKTILTAHKEQGLAVSDVDNSGNTPFHRAILNCSSYDAISAFKEILGNDERLLNLYLKANRAGDLPLHCALNQPELDSEIIFMLLQAAPFTGGLKDSKGKMPVALATSSSRPSDIVMDLLKTDMPISLGSSRCGDVVKRNHGHSWWHCAIECNDLYQEELSDLLANATYAEIVFLARSCGPDGRTRTIDAAPCGLEDILRNKLRLLDRFDISTDIAPRSVNNVQYFSAVDTKDATEGSKRKEVTLRCYTTALSAELFQGEITIRKNFDVQSTFVETMQASYKANKDIITGASQVISFFRPSHTVEQILSIDHTKNMSWLINCRILMKSVAEALLHLHNAGLVHGHLNPSLIGHFAGNWKLMEIGRSRQIGSSMIGEFRSYVPPESIVEANNGRQQSEENSGDDGRRFRPEICMASPSWDAFAFGAIMAQLLFDGSHVLPALEKNDEKEVNRLSTFGTSDLNVIHEEILSTAGPLAADLIVRLLNPSPETRLNSMSKVLCHRYFYDPVCVGDGQIRKKSKNSLKHLRRKASKKKNKKTSIDHHREYNFRDIS